MRLLGKIWKSKTSCFWLIEVRDLDLLTQGETKKDAYELMKAAIEELVDEKNFKVEIHPEDASNFTVAANASGPFLALLLRRQREAQGLTVREVSRRLGSESPNAYARYEQGQRMPTVEKLKELLEAVNNEGPVLQARYFPAESDEYIARPKAARRR